MKRTLKHYTAGLLLLSLVCSDFAFAETKAPRLHVGDVIDIGGVKMKVLSRGELEPVDKNNSVSMVPKNSPAQKRKLKIGDSFMLGGKSVQIAKDGTLVPVILKAIPVPAADLYPAPQSSVPKMRVTPPPLNTGDTAPVTQIVPTTPVAPVVKKEESPETPAPSAAPTQPDPNAMSKAEKDEIHNNFVTTPMVLGGGGAIIVGGTLVVQAVRENARARRQQRAEAARDYVSSPPRPYVQRDLGLVAHENSGGLISNANSGSGSYREQRVRLGEARTRYGCRRRLGG